MGYELYLASTPHQCVPPKELTFARDEIETLETEITNTTLKGALCTAAFYSQMFTVPEKDGGHRSIINKKKPKQVCKSSTFQDGEHNHATGHSTGKRLHDKSTLERCLLHGAHSGKAPRPTEVQMEGQSLATSSIAFPSGYRRPPRSLPRS